MLFLKSKKARLVTLKITRTVKDEPSAIEIQIDGESFHVADGDFSKALALGETVEALHIP